MAPEAESKVRRRRDHEKEANTSSKERIISTVKGLQNNEVAIDGVVYDLDSFVHPGGSTIGVFGGNDVTVQYKMIHAHHSNSNGDGNKHLEKMKKVGRLVDFTSE